MIRDEIERLLRPSIEALGLIWWGLEFHKQGRGYLLRIFIDKPDGILLDDCEAVSRQVGALLDVEDPIPGKYQLEVSSPGEPRPLFYPEQYAHYIGKEVQIRISQAQDGQRNFTGMIKSVEEDTLILAEGDTEQPFYFSNITKAHLTVERGEA